MSQQALKRQLLSLLKSDDIAAIISEIRRLSGPDLLKPLFSGICSANELVKWHAVTALGIVVPDIADHDMESARVVMRRFMWSLNDESGGIGWGAPEAMGEILANHAGLAGEYCHILVSFMREDGFFLEYEPLQRGLMWGIGRLAQVRAALLRAKEAIRYQLPYLDSADHVVRGLACWSMGILQAAEAVPRLEQMQGDKGELHLYHEHRLTTVTTGSLAEQALAAINRGSRS